jgi:hypothetical protein
MPIVSSYTVARRRQPNHLDLGCVRSADGAFWGVLRQLYYRFALVLPAATRAGSTYVARDPAVTQLRTARATRMSDSPIVLCEALPGGVQLITLNKPERMNAWSGDA